jgi:hypothetical protein
VVSFPKAREYDLPTYECSATCALSKSEKIILAWRGVAWRGVAWRGVEVRLGVEVGVRDGGLDSFAHCVHRDVRQQEFGTAVDKPIQPESQEGNVAPIVAKNKPAHPSTSTHLTQLPQGVLEQKNLRRFFL